MPQIRFVVRTHRCNYDGTGAGSVLKTFDVEVPAEMYEYLNGSSEVIGAEVIGEKEDGHEEH